MGSIAYVAVHDSSSTAGSIRLAEFTVCVWATESLANHCCTQLNFIAAVIVCVCCFP